MSNAEAPIVFWCVQDRDVTAPIYIVQTLHDAMDEWLNRREWADSLSSSSDATVLPGTVTVVGYNDCPCYSAHEIVSCLVDVPKWIANHYDSSLLGGFVSAVR